jgi:Uma2 family endonuclease
MSRSAAAAITPLPFELVTSDGEPMDDIRHPIQLGLFWGLVHRVMKERGRNDYFVGGNNFVYYSTEQAWDVVKGRKYFRGPDIFFVDRVAAPQAVAERGAWVAWEQGGRLPDLIIELLSPSTEHIERTDKMDLYARTFQTAEYYLYDFETRKLEGFRRTGDLYQPVEPNSQGRFWSEQLGAEIGLWRGVYGDTAATWIRLFQPDGRMVPTGDERAEAERQRAEAAEAELVRLRARLGE